MKTVNGILLIILVTVLWMRWFGAGGAMELREKEELYVQQQKKNEKLKQRNENLQAEVIDLDDGLEALEERARSELGMVKDGETFIQVIE